MNLLYALFTRNLLMSGVAIVRYIPRAFRVKQVDGNLFFTEEKRQEYRRRVESVTSHSPRQWGTMEVDQILHHLNLACGGSLGFYNLPDESYLTSRTVFKRILVVWFPEEPVGLRLPADFKIPHSQRFEFSHDKAQLLKIVEANRRRGFGPEALTTIMDNKCGGASQCSRQKENSAGTNS